MISLEVNRFLKFEATLFGGNYDQWFSDGKIPEDVAAEISPQDQADISLVFACGFDAWAIPTTTDAIDYFLTVLILLIILFLLF